MKTGIKLTRPSSANNNSRLPLQDPNTSLHKPSNPYKLPNNQVNLPRPKQSQQQHSFITYNKPSSMEWERLYEESLQLKTLMNQHKEENIKLKTQNANLQKDLQKCTKIIEEMETTGNMKRFYAKPSTDNQMILHLKTQVKELKEQLTERENELTTIKKSSKYTKLTEMEVEKKMFQDETVRLTQFIEELVQQNIQAQQAEHDQVRLQEMLEQRDNFIKQMQSDLDTMDTERRELEEKFNQILKAYQDLDKQYVKLDTDSKSKLKAKDKQIQMLKTDIQRMQSDQEKAKKNMVYQQKILNNKTPNNQNYLQKPKPQQFSPNKLTDKSLQANNTSKTQTNRVQSAKPDDTIQRAVEIGEIDTQIQEIKYKLIAEGVQSSKIDQYLFNPNTQQTTIQQLIDNFEKQPFLLEKSEALKLSRFLVEKASQVYPYQLNLQMHQDNGLIRGLFFKTIGFWALYDQVEQKVIEVSLNKLFDGLLPEIEKRMSRQVFSKQNFVQQINQILGEKNRQIRELELQYIISKIIKQSKKLNQLKGIEFATFIQEIQQNGEYNESIPLEELQKYYDNINDNKHFFFYKQQRSKQEQMLALLEQEPKQQQNDNENEVEDLQGSKTTQQYLIKSGLVRSHSDPDPYQIQQMEEEDDEDYYQQNQYEQDEFDQKEYEKQMRQKLKDQNQKKKDDNDNDNDNEEEEQYDQYDDEEQDLDEAKINYEDDDYNMNVEHVFDEDDENDDQWEKLEHTGNLPIRQDRQIPNSRPTSSYVNKVNKSGSEIKMNLESVQQSSAPQEIQEIKSQINQKQSEDDYYDEEFEDDN